MPTLSLLRFLSLVSLFTALGYVNEARAVQPSHDDALRFGYKLQEEFTQKKAAAFTEHLDHEAMWRRIFTPFGASAINDPETPQIFESQFLPILLDQLVTFDEFDYLLLSRVMLIENARYLELVVNNAEGSFLIILARLTPQASGTIGISDLRMHGSLLEFSQVIRDMLITAGVPAMGPLDDGEMTLKLSMPLIRPIFNQVIHDMNQGNLEEAFEHWLRAPEDVRATAFWRNLRARLAYLGSNGALKALHHSIKEGQETDPLLKLSYAIPNPTPADRLRLMDEVLQAKQEMPFLRALKAGILLELGKTREALELAQDVYTLTPFTITAYIVAIHAAYQLDLHDDILSTLNQWVFISPIEDIDQIMQDVPELAEYISTEEYLTWREQQQSTASAEPKS